jgi:hypothetical protein
MVDSNELNYKLLCLYCFDTLIKHLKNEKTPTPFPKEFKDVMFPT